MRIDIMTDIETLGTNPDSTIIQISAIAFDIHTGKYLAEFNQITDIKKNQKMNVTGATLAWWLDTNKELLHTLINSGEKSSEDVMRDFHAWIKGLSTDSRNIYLWGNGIMFDNKLIEHQMKAIGLDYPVFFRNDRDMRTIVDLAAAKIGISEHELREMFRDESLVLHNAFDDVKYQINVVSNCYQLITKNYMLNGTPAVLA